MNWVKKSSFEKIRRLSEIFEQERHYKVLLTLDNISAVRRNPSPYTLPIIPRPLPSDIMEGEHFVIADLQRLISSSAHPSGDPVVEASSRVQGAGSASGSSTSPSEDSNSAHPIPSQRTRSSRPERLPLPGRVAGSAPRVVKIKHKGAAGRRNAPGSKGEDFVPWVSFEHEDFQDLEEEEREERMTGLLDSYAARKRQRQLSSGIEFDIAPAQAAGPSQPAAEGGSEVQVIIIPGSPESGPIDQTEPAGVARIESKEADPVPSALQVIPPSDRDEGQPSRLKFIRSELPRPTLPEQIITNCYAPLHGPEPPRVEISPGADEVKRIMRHWESFHRGESAADRLNNLYPHMLQMPVAARGMGLGEDYTVSVPVGTRKEDIQRIIDDGIQVCNHNYVQSTELVR